MSVTNDNSLFNLRFISISSQLVTFIAFFSFSFRLSKSIALSTILCLTLYGSAQHMLYFLMARPDGLFFTFGFAAVCLAFWELAAGSKSIVKWMLVGILIALSVMTKQTGIFYFIAVLSILIVRSVREKSWLPSLSTYLITFFVISAIFFSTDHGSWIGFHVGLDLFASEISHYHIVKQILDGIRTYLWLMIATVIVLYRAYKKHDLKYEIAAFTIVTFIISIKLFSNAAAHYNNYILLTSLSCLILAIFYKELNKKWIILCLLLLNYIQGHFQLSDTIIKNGVGDYREKIANAGNLEESDLFKFIEAKNGKYLTSRNDNILYFSNNEIIYEGSVLDSILFHESHLNHEARQDIENYKNEIEKMIKRKEIDAVVDGIGGWFSHNYPSLRNYYEKTLVQKIHVGDWPHEIQLWTPKP